MQLDLSSVAWYDLSQALELTWHENPAACMRRMQSLSTDSHESTRVCCAFYNTKNTFFFQVIYSHTFAHDIITTACDTRLFHRVVYKIIHATICFYDSRPSCKHFVSLHCSMATQRRRPYAAVLLNFNRVAHINVVANAS